MDAYGLIGRSLGHSFSERYFRERFSREGITNASYSLFELPEIEALPALLEAHPDLRGFNVTNPYKQTIIPYLDDLSAEARLIGAVNCVKREGERWVGYNTDVVGLRDSLSELLNPWPEEALILGTGGASLAVQFVLAQWGLPYLLLSRDPLRGNYTYDNLPVEVLQQCRLVINATPVGTYPAVDEAPRLPYAFLTPDHCLFDLVYNPSETAFLDYGRQRGARTKNGYEMLVGQAEAAWEIWSKE